MFKELARLLRIPHWMADDAMRSERAARATLDRRGFLLAGASAAGFLASKTIFGEFDLYPGYIRLTKDALDTTFDAPVLIDAPNTKAHNCLFKRGVRILSADAAVLDSKFTGALPDGYALSFAVIASGARVIGCHFDLRDIGAGIEIKVS